MNCGAVYDYDKMSNEINVKLSERDSSKIHCNIMPSLINVPVYIHESDIITGSKEILLTIRPHWNLNFVHFKNFTDGITNKLIGCFYNPPPFESTTSGASNIKYTNCSNTMDIFQIGNNINDKFINQIVIPHSSAVLLRIYGNKTDLLIDREQEIENFQLLHKYKFAPCLYATFKNGLAYEYVPGITLNRDNILQPKLWSLIACRMAEMHRLVKCNNDDHALNEKLQPMLLKKMELFFKLVPERFHDAEKQKRLQDMFLPIKRMRDEFNELYKHLEKLNSPIVFSHNDLLLGNIIFTEKENKVTFIDYEYADYNYQAFDIGNHFAEFAGVDTVDYKYYPNRKFQLKWLRVYLESYLQTNNINNIQLERLYVQVNQFALAAHLFWTLWSLVQAEYSTINFDYVEYASVRYNEYLRRKNEFLSLNWQN